MRFLSLSLGVCRPCFCFCFCERMHACMYTWFTTAAFRDNTTACSHSEAAECGDAASESGVISLLIVAARPDNRARSQNNSHAYPTRALINSQNNSSCTSAPGKTSTNLSQTYNPRVQSDRWILPRMLSLHTESPNPITPVCVHGPWYASAPKQKGAFHSSN